MRSRTWVRIEKSSLLLRFALTLLFVLGLHALGVHAFFSLDAVQSITVQQQEEYDPATLRPISVAFSPEGNIYVGERDRIRVFTDAGNYIRDLGSESSGSDGSASTGLTLSFPQGISVAADESIWIAETNQNRVIGVDASGEILYIVGPTFTVNAESTSSDGQTTPGSTITLNRPQGVAVNDEWVVIADTGNHQVHVVARDGRYIASFGSLGSSDTELSQPKDVAIDAEGFIYVADDRNQRVQVLRLDSGLVFEHSIPLPDRPQQVAVLPGDHSKGILVATSDQVLNVDRDGNVIARFTAESIGGLSSVRSLAVSWQGRVGVADSEGVVFVSSDLTDPRPVVEFIDPTTARITWESILPGDAQVTYQLVTEATGVDEVGADEAGAAAGPVTVVSTGGEDRIHSLQLPDLVPDARYTYTVTPTLSAIPPRDGVVGRFITPPPAGYTQFITAPTLAVIFHNDKMTEEDIEIVRGQLEGVRLWYWVNSYMTWNMVWDLVVIDEVIPEPKGFVGPGETQDAIERALAKQGKSIADYTGVVVYAPIGPWQGDRSRIAYRNQALGGAAFGVPTPWPNRQYADKTGYAFIGIPYGSDITWVTLHEYHHQLDALHHASGFPEYAHADIPIELPGRFGEHYDFNAAIARGLPRESWLLNDYGTRMLAVDADGDLVPDDDPRVPLDEARFGSDPTRRSSNGSELTDLELIMTSTWVPHGLGLDETRGTHLPMPDPTQPDTDGDGTLDHLDPYPLYALNPVISRTTPTIDGHIEPGEWTEFYTMDDQDIHAQTFLGWDDDYLYFAVRLDRYAIVRLRLDTLANGWFHGRDNYEIELRPIGRAERPQVQAHILDNSIETGPYYANTTLAPASTFIAQYRDLDGGGYEIELAVPRNERTYLLPQLGREIGVHLTFNATGSTRRWISMFEPHAWVYLQMSEVGDLR